MLPEKQPNVIIVMTDDQGYANLSCMGHPILKTPHVDQLFAESVRLADYHVDPTCAPTRAAMMTGRYSDRTGVWHTVLGRHQMRLRETTMAEVFKDSGYRTGIFGKWHLGDLFPFRPQDRGFDETLIHSGGGVGQGPDYWGNDYFDDTYQVNGEWKQFKGFCTDVFFDQSLDFMQGCIEDEQPFLTWVTTNAPHGPFYAPERNFERFRGYEHEGERLEDETAGYYGMIENIDENLGKLVAFLKEQGVYDDTILVFTSDNGPVTEQGIQIYNAQLRGGKCEVWDGGHLVPFFMSWPNGGLSGGRDVAPATAHFDLLPTLIELCGLKDPQVEFDGKSLVPLLRDSEEEWEPRSFVVESQRVYHPEKYRLFAVVEDGWRLVGQEELYDIEKDRGQRNDVSRSYPERVVSMKATYEAFWEDVSKDHHIVSLPVVGRAEANPVCLQSHDWTSEGFWNQPHILRPFDQEETPIGKWVMDVAESGWYQISFRRWPAEADEAIVDAYVGQAADVCEARLRFRDEELKSEILPDTLEVTFRIRIDQGEFELDAIFCDRSGESVISPFYAYVCREDGREMDGWQTREGLGLPQAEWPVVHGRDPSVESTFAR
ncbi:arylsulfatase [Pelagicoccus mobilis]|uniref:Arylsulfatase n=1 Tax=Pelagicoccus mobilis TaxID=415221 RepID=A0A934RWZ2_9BACT|nr:arylsulfatase [Pelagicoccus mobilis]MBK1875922.1 arylsulfatase [Pelagicoccus mobilis]